MTANSLTGVWDGLYCHPQHAPVAFLATLIESGSTLGGTTTEPCMMPGCHLSTHHAMLAGGRSGSAVSFIKRYDPPGFGYGTVFYEGVLNGDATEINGRWALPGHALSGTFLMVRSGKAAQARKTEGRVTVRVG
jgi:hypothetical protein